MMDKGEEAVKKSPKVDAEAVAPLEKKATASKKRKAAPVAEEPDATADKSATRPPKRQKKVAS